MQNKTYTELRENIGVNSKKLSLWYFDKNTPSLGSRLLVDIITRVN